MRESSERSLGELRFGGALATAKTAKVLAALAALGGSVIAVTGAVDLGRARGATASVSGYVGAVIGSTAVSIVFLLALAYGLELLVAIFDELDDLRLDTLSIASIEGNEPDD